MIDTANRESELLEAFGSELDTQGAIESETYTEEPDSEFNAELSPGSVNDRGFVAFMDRNGESDQNDARVFLEGEICHRIDTNVDLY